MFKDYVCEGGGAVAVIDTVAGAVRDTIAVGDVPTTVAVTPDGALAYVATERCEWFSYLGGEFCQGTIVVIDTAARVAAARIPVRGRPIASAIAPDGSRLYAAQARDGFGGTGEIVAIDTATSAIAWTMPLDVEPSGIAVGRGGRIAYVAGQRSLQLGEIDALDTRDGRLLARLPLADSWGPSPMAASNDGAFLYFGTTAGCGYALTIVDVARFSIAGYVNLPSYPAGLALTGDGRLAYVSGERGVAVVDLEERTVVAEHRLDDMSGAVAILCGEKSCGRRPTPIPRTPPAAAPTLPPLPTRTPDVCLQGNPCVRPVAVSGAPGDLVVLEVMLGPTYFSIGRVAHDLTFEPDTPIGADDSGHPNCQVNPDIEKQDTTFAFLPAGCIPGQDCRGIHAVVRSFEDESAISPPAVLYRCHVRIASDAAPGSRVVAVSNVTASPPDGGDDAWVVPVDGTVDVSAAAELTEGGAGGGSAGCSSTGSGKRPAWPALLVAPAVLCFLRRRARNLK